MSQESAIAFYDHLENDSALMERISKLSPPEVEALVKDELGYSFTKEEMQQVIFERNPELSDEEMEAVVGGLSGYQGMVIGSIIIAGFFAAVVAAG